ncbi:MAG TPA: HPr(Ser) kinase/phosphatase, partial [Longimicrobium sp.]
LSCVVVTRREEPPKAIVLAAEATGTPLFMSAARSSRTINMLHGVLDEKLAPNMSLHGVLVDVFGIGLLLIGKSGIGKSETVLDLVERGHRLVADDLVMITRRGHEVLIGKGHDLQRHHMEIRGVGIIDIRTMFGVRAIRQQKRIEVVVQLEIWDENAVYDRTGLDTKTMDILGIPVPMVTVPLVPGKNITVVCEVVAMNHLLKYSGVDTARLFNQRLQNRMAGVSDYLEEDYE